MRIGIIGVGVVGGTLLDWFHTRTSHDVKLRDPFKGFHDSLEGCEHIFISVPVPARDMGQDLSNLRSAVLLAKQYTNNVFIRSTVLPGTNDTLGTIAMPEFLTERTARQDFEDLPIIVGKAHKNINLEDVFPGKEIIFMSNTEAELAKFTHNCFGAMKVTYFNIIEELSRKFNANYKQVLAASFITGFIEPQHTQVPGPDGKKGYGGKCFPENIDAMRRFLSNPELNMRSAHDFFSAIDLLNAKHRWCEKVYETRPEVGL